MRSAKTKWHQYQHAKRRCLERYREEITEEVYESLIKKIKDQRAKLLMRESNTRAHYFVDEKYIVVYDSARKSICTFLPPENLLSYISVDGEDASV